MAEKKAKGKRAGKAYNMPEKIKKGEILKDVRKVEWMIKDSIGKGGFGEIYAGVKVEEPNLVRYAIKIEPHENGPLFCERTVYANIAKEKDLEEYIKLKKLRYLGIPTFHGFGSHVYKEKDYRFIVIDKLGSDVQSLFATSRSTPYDTVLKIAVQVLNVLEYMHEKGYVHCDIKGANLLMGAEKSSEHNVYVVDFGLACKFAANDKPNPKKAHNGTLEYTSRDAHRGVMTRRGDVEVLGYNILHWATTRLPWLADKTPPGVADKKETYMSSIDDLLAACYKTDKPQTAVKDYLKCISKLEPLDVPDYAKLRQILVKDVKALKSDLNKLVFNAVATPKKRRASSRSATPVHKKVVVTQSDSEDDIFATPEATTPKPRKRGESKENDVAASPRPRKTKTEVAVKRSWRDCPTVMNSVPRK